MFEHVDKGTILRWRELADGPAGRVRRVLVEAGPPASPHDVLRLIWSLDGGPERATRGRPLPPDPATGLQRFVADLPAGAPAGALRWRPVLTAGGREIDPGMPAAEPAIHQAAHAAIGSLAAAVPGALGALASAAGPAASGPAHPELALLGRFTLPFDGDFHPIGATPDGVRLRFGLRAGGRVEGERLSGDILPVGGDWMRVRPDGIGVLDARAIIQPDAGGGPIMLEETGLCDFGDAGFAALARGELPASAPVRVTPRYLTSNPRFLWLNRVQGFGVGVARLADVTLQIDVYTVPEPGHG